MPQQTSTEESYLRAAMLLVIAMGPEKRQEFISALSAQFCLHCGIPQPTGRPCQCSNDE
jgi:hypothetical protein